MVWAVDKMVVRYPLDDGERFAEVPVRTRFEYAVEDGVVAPGSLRIDTLYNKREALRHFRGVGGDWLDGEVERAARQAVYEHLRRCGYTVGADAESDPGAAGDDAP